MSNLVFEAKINDLDELVAKVNRAQELIEELSTVLDGISRRPIKIEAKINQPSGGADS